MAYFALLWKARTIEKYRLQYEKEKINSIVAANAELPKHTFYQKWKLYRYDSQKKLSRICRILCPEGSKVSNFFVYLKTDQTFSNFLVKSVIGFVGGIVLTYFWFMFFVFQLSISLIHATIMSSIIGVLLTLGLAFSYRIRCLVFLLIPQFFSRVGRYTLTCYALVLILTGPATNTLKNSEVLSESLACGQEQVKSNVNKLLESTNKPLYLLKDTVGTTVKKLKCLSGKFKELMMEIHRLTLSLAHVLQSSLSWLNSVEAICNAKVGSPYDHCTKVLSHDLSRKRKSNLDYLVQAVCFNLKTVDSMCVVGDFAKGSIVANVRKKLETFSTRISSMMFVGVHVKRSHSCYSNASRSASQVAAGIVTEIRTRADPLLTWLSWSSCLTSLFLLLIIFRAKYYQQMFETRSRFDNRYVTKELRDLDLRRLRQGRKTVLPLNTRERAKYVSTTSFRLLASERVHLTRSIVFMIITTFKLLIHMVADYSLYWVLMNIRFHGRFQTVLQPGHATAGIKVSGSGPLSGIVRGLIDALSVPLALPSPSPISCLPNPHPPDFQRYAQIGILILLLWLCALCEPYGLRLRHVIMGHYQPERAQARASWLYNHIIRTRGCFLKHARRKLHRDYKHSTEESHTFKRWLTYIIPCRCLRYLLGLGPKEPHCLLCGTKKLQNDPDTYLKRCETPSCPGVYCARCFLDIGQLCTICLSPRDYGDLSDVSLEKWSSEDSDNDDSNNDSTGTKEPLLRLTDTFSGVNKHESLSSNNMTRSNTSGVVHRTKDQSSNQETFHILNYGNFKSNKKGKTDAFKARSSNNKQLEENNELEQSVQKYNTRVVVRDADRLLKSVEAPKEKLSGIMNTMRLLTKKMDAGEIHKEWKRHDSNKFEYLVMELFQPMDIFKKALFVRHAKHAHIGTQVKNVEKDKTLEEVIPFLRMYEIGNTIETNTDIVLKDANMYVSRTSENIIDTENKTELLQSTKSKISTRKRDIKAIKQNYVKLKQTISADVVRLRKRRIYFSKIKLVSKRRRRNNPKKCIILQTMRVGKALNECVESEIDKLKAELEYEINKINAASSEPKKAKNVIDKKTFNANIRKLSNNIVSDVSSDINASDIKDQSSTPEENNGNKNKDLGQANPHTTIACKTQDDQSKCVLHGLCTKLWHLVRSSLTPQKPLSSSKQEEPSTNNIANHKRRKKPLMLEQKHACKTTMLNNDARNYRISLYLKEQDWVKKQTDSDPPEHLNEVLMKLKKKSEKRKIKEAEILKREVQKNLMRELKLKAKAELKLKKQMKKQKIAEEKKKHQMLKKQLDAQTAKQTPKTKSDKNKKEKKDKKGKALSNIKEEVLPKETSTSFAEKLMNNVAKEMCSSDKVRLPNICLSNNLNFYGFNNPILDLPEENFNLDEIFGDDKETLNKDTESEQTSKVNSTYYHDVAEKHQCQPSYWPYARYGVTQTGIAEEKYEKTLEAKAGNYGTKGKRNKGENTTKKITAKSIKSAVSEVYVEMKKPVTKMKNLCSCLKERTASRTLAARRSPNEKAIHVAPITMSRSCQDLSFPAIFNKYTQSHVIKVKHCPTQCDSDKCFCGEHDIGVAAEQETCTCAAQCTLRCQGDPVRKVNVGTMHNNAYKRTTNVAIQYEHYRRCTNEALCDLCENPKFALPNLNNCQCHTCGGQAECPPYIPEAEEDRWNVQCQNEERTCTKPKHKTTRHILCQCDPCGGDYSGSATSIFCESDSDGTGNTVTDTICTHVAIDYDNDKHKRKRVNVVKKNNQSTITDKQKLVDVSTITGDWWSPMVERKKDITLEKKTGDCSLNQKEKMEDKSSRYLPAKRIAPVKSHEKHQARDNGILSPSKYILECQENDYGLFSPGIPPIVAMTCVKKLNEERSNFAYGAHRHTRKGHKSKRLEESYSPRKKTQTSSVSLSPAKWRPADRNEDTAHALRHYKLRNDKLQSSQKSRSMQKNREKVTSRTSRHVKRLQVTRSVTDIEKDRDSEAGQCNSTSSLAIT